MRLFFPIGLRYIIEAVYFLGLNLFLADGHLPFVPGGGGGANSFLKGHISKIRFFSFLVVAFFIGIDNIVKYSHPLIPFIMFPFDLLNMIHNLIQRIFDSSFFNDVVIE